MRNISLIYSRIRILDRIFVSCESKGNIEVNLVSKDNDSTSQTGLLND